MITHFRTIASILLAVGLMGTSASAEHASIEGTVKAPDGKPLAGAQLRVERVDAKAPVATTKTDAKGNYALKGLPLGVYKVTPDANSAPKLAAVIRTQSDRVRIDFDLGAKTTANKVKRYVWVTDQMGTHISGGRWMEVGAGMSAGAVPVDIMSSQGARGLQNNASHGGSGR